MRKLSGKRRALFFFWFYCYLEIIFSSKANFLRKDKLKLEVISYLCIFNANYSDLIFSWLGTLKRNQGLSFLDFFIEEDLIRRLKNAWNGLMEEKFVARKLIEPIKSNRDNFIKIKQRLLKKVSALFNCKLLYKRIYFNSVKNFQGKF